MEDEVFFVAVGLPHYLPKIVYVAVICIQVDEDGCLPEKYRKLHVDLLGEKLQQNLGYDNKDNTYVYRTTEIIQESFSTPQEAIAYAKAEWTKVFGPIETEEVQHIPF